MGIWFVTDLEDYSFDFWDGLLNDGGDKNAGFGENKSHACVVGGCGQLPFWVFAAGIIWRGTNLSVWGFSSDLDQNRAVLWSKSEMKHLKHPEHLKLLKHFLWMPGLLFCKHFKELGGKVKDGVEVRQYQKGMFHFWGGIDAIDLTDPTDPTDLTDPTD